MEAWHEASGTVIVTVAELDAKDVEIQWLKANAAMWERLCLQAQDLASRALRDLELMRKASDETTAQAAPIPGPKTMVGSGALVAIADALDHRLGTALPEGEPCEPRPAGARWRAMV
jgi:hypothetical protein